MFPGFTFAEHLELRESLYCDPESIEEFWDTPYSNIFLWHTNFYLRTSTAFSDSGQGDIKRAIEIGCGYGGLARIYELMNPGISYTLVDLPESLFFAHNYLMLNFPDAKILYLDEDNQQKLDEHYDFVFVPVQASPLLAGRSFDVVTNTASLQEMTGETVAFWMDFIERQIEVKAFYSCNYFLKLDIWGEVSGDNLICPILDPYWKSKHFKINPPVITADAHSVNLLEFYVERIPSGEWDDSELPRDAAEMSEQARLEPMASDEWFEKLWMSIWKFPTQESISEMLYGLRVCKQRPYKRELVRPKKVDLSFWWGQTVRVFRAMARLRPRPFVRTLRSFRRGKHFFETSEYSEERFYKNMLTKL
jgi:SAM-dependent methyltransferase